MGAPRRIDDGQARNVVDTSPPFPGMKIPMSSKDPIDPTPQDAPYPQPSVPASEENMWAMHCHLSALLLGGFGLGWLGPLVIWLIQREKMPLVDDQGKEALNFQISLIIYSLVCIPFCFIMIGFIMILGLAVFSLVVTIIGAMQAYQGIAYRYPACIRLIP